MKKTLFTLSSVAMLLSATTAFSESAPATQTFPVSHSYKSLEAAPTLQIPALDMEKIAKEDASFSKFEKTYRFAVAYDALNSYTSKGKWSDAGDQAIWRLKVDAKDTKNLSFGFKDVFLPTGAQLFVYSKDYSQVVGPFTEKDNNSFQELWTPLIHGGEAIIEISVPKKLQRYATFDLTHINQGYKGIDPVSRAKSGSCNIDVVCPVADPWKNEIRSVASYTFNKGGSTFVCTGTLMNNTALDRKPYFLTANHCVSDQTVASSMVFYWNYETSSCGGTPDGARNQSQSGATLRSTWSGSDLTLVELNSAPSSSFNVHWAGWDNSAPAPSSSVAIHHPAGDEKRISFDDDAATLTNYSSNTQNSNGSHIRIGAWDQGTTEGGSSGSAIWNANKHVVGTLHGGLASCQAPNDPDWYGRVSQQWEGGGTAGSQLKAWLDPADTKAVTLDGVDACTPPTASIDSITPNPAQRGDTISFATSVSGGSGSGYTYAWDFDGNGSIDSTESNPSYSYGENYTGNVSLTVTDSVSCEVTTVAAIVVEGPNRAPTASVASSTLSANEGSTVSLNASSSSDPDGDTLTYAWTQTSGTSVTINNGTTSTASFVAPQVTAATTLEFEVTVTDPSGESSSATVSVTVNDVPPPASGGGGGSTGLGLIALLALLGLRKRKLA
ncbi:MAG: trypsin-like peptidase domain-containing protein [Gammaproteobacteria bacterium]|nr:trypsin-like peptidase domain-containing protein [Gammaproteobacteria bacterium]